MSATPIRVSSTDPLVTAAAEALSPFGREIFEVGLDPIFYIDTDLVRDGDLDAEWARGFTGERGIVTLILAGDLRVTGDIEGSHHFNLIVLGDVHCRQMHTGWTTWVSVAGDVHATEIVTMTYNDTATSIDRTTHARCVLISDHRTNITPSPDTVVLDDGYDHKEAFRAIADPAVLRGGALYREALIEHVAAGGSPVRVDLRAIRETIADIPDAPAPAVDRLCSLGAAGFVEFHGPTQGLTPLHWLALAEPVWSAEVDGGSLVRRLLHAGAELEPTLTCRGFPNRPTPLQLAVMRGSARVAAALLEAGADLDRPAADGSTLDAQMLASLRSLYDAEVDADAVDEAYTRSTELLATLGYANIGELRRVVTGHVEAIREGRPDPTSTLRYRPRGWSERAWWSDAQGTWLLPIGDIPGDATYDPEEREWIVEGPGIDGYALQRRYFRPTDGTLCCVANIQDPSNPNHFDMVRYHNDGSVSMIATWHDGRWHGEKIDYPGRGKTSEKFVIYTVPPNMARAVTIYEGGRPTSIAFYDHDGVAIDQYGARVDTGDAGDAGDA